MGSTEISKWGVNLGRIDIVIQKEAMIQSDINNVRTCIEDRVL
jgi:hypothetical protein